MGWFCTGTWNCGAVWRGVGFCGAGWTVGLFCTLAGVARFGGVWREMAGFGVSVEERLADRVGEWAGHAGRGVEVGKGKMGC
jgi:hypothetical protein